MNPSLRLRWWRCRWYLRYYRLWMKMSPIDHLAQLYMNAMNALWDRMTPIEQRFCQAREGA